MVPNSDKPGHCTQRYKMSMCCTKLGRIPNLHFQVFGSSLNFALTITLEDCQQPTRNFPTELQITKIQLSPIKYKFLNVNDLLVVKAKNSQLVCILLVKTEILFISKENMEGSIPQIIFLKFCIRSHQIYIYIRSSQIKFQLPK